MAGRTRIGLRAGGWLAVSLLLSLTILPTETDAQPLVRLGVVYHSQVPPGDPNVPGNWPWTEPGNGQMPNGFCTNACIDMLFSFYENAAHGNPPLPQQEIAAVANTNDAVGGGMYSGTYETDARRAVHFSSTTPVWPSAPPPYAPVTTGYAWRGAAPGGAIYGWVGIDGDWAANGWGMAAFKATLANGWPLICHVDADSVAAYLPALDPDEASSSRTGYTSVQNTVLGHSVVIIGYDDNRNVFFLHDPTLGCWLMLNQQTFWNAWWADKDFLFVAPWLSGITVPALGSFIPQGFQITGTAFYLDGLPAGGTGVALQSASGSLWFPGAQPVAGLAQGQARTIAFNQVVTSGQSQQRNWQCVTVRWGTSQATVETWGRVSTVAQSFPGGYIDDIGNTATSNVTVPLPMVMPDPSICRIPRIHWWLGDHVGLPSLNFFPGAPVDLTADVENRGTALASNVLVRFYVSDPCLAECYPDPVLSYLGSAMIPSLPPGDTVTTSPVTFFPPPGNAFGQPYYGFVVTCEAPGDPMHDTWVELDNNVACRSTNRAEIAPDSTALFGFFAVNPFSEMRWVVTRLESDMPPDWSAQLEPAGTDSVLLPPGARDPRTLRVEAGSSVAIGTFDVFEDVFGTDGAFLRRTGGVRFTVSTARTGVPGREAAAGVALSEPAPNPTRGTARFWFSLPAARHVEVALFDAAGRRVVDLFRADAPAGRTPLFWDGRDASGSPAASGTYFVRLEAGGERHTRTLVVLR